MPEKPEKPEAMLILTTTDTEARSREIAELLVERRLVACVNVVPGVVSIYRWAGKLARDEEFLLLCKTTPERFEEVRSAIHEIHTYDCPEVIGLEIDAGDRDYLTWLSGATRSGGGTG